MFGWRRSSVKPDPVEEAPTSSDEGEGFSPEVAGSDDLARLLDMIEALAARIYADHGLPAEPGHYRRTDEGDDWSLVSRNLSPAEKFDLILAAKDQDRVRYAAYDRIGAQHDSPLVRKAAALVAASRGLRHRLEIQAPITAQTLADAVRLGGLYQVLATNMSDPMPPDLTS
jgi:hypothetical protein